MRVVLYPFFSQQDKVAGKFRLASDSGVKLYRYMARRMQERGWDVSMVLPHPMQCVDEGFNPGCCVLYPPYPVALSNLDRRCQWHPDWLKTIAHKCDLFMTQHEFLAIPLRILEPQLRIVMECGIKPETAWPSCAGLFQLAWRAASMVHCNSEELARMVRAGGAAKAVLWQFAYNEALIGDCTGTRDVDVVFPARASETEYSNHTAFMEAVAPTALNVVMTDPTSYLRRHGTSRFVTPSPLNGEEYRATLRRSKVVVSLTRNGYGGYAFREAIASGCVPVALREPEYVDLLGTEWPYYAESLQPNSIRSAVEHALACGWSTVPAATQNSIAERLKESSYGGAWQKALHDLGDVL